jgi:hypothetical protein
MKAIQDSELQTSCATGKTCTECRFGAGHPQGPQGLMRCVNPGYFTVGQFLRGPAACEGFQARIAAKRQSHAVAA